MNVVHPPPHVRFSPDCFLIPPEPPHSIRPHFEARTVSLPIGWIRKPHDADANDPNFSPARPPSLVVKVPRLVLTYPAHGLYLFYTHSFSRRTRVHSPERDCHVKGCLHSPTSPPRSIPPSLPSIFDDEPLSTSPSRAMSPVRSQSLPPPVTIVPLRPCCQACYNKMLVAAQADYVPFWSPGAKRKKERDEREAHECEKMHNAFASCPNVEAFALHGHHGRGFGLAKVDEVEVRHGKGAPVKSDLEESPQSDSEEPSLEEESATSSTEIVDHHPTKISIPYLAPTADDLAYADRLPPELVSPVSSPAPVSTSPTTGRRVSFSSSGMFQACLRGGAAVLKGVTSGDGGRPIITL